MYRIDDSDVRAVVDEVLLQLVHPARRPLQRVRVVEGRTALLMKKEGDMYIDSGGELHQLEQRSLQLTLSLLSMSSGK